MNKKKDRDIKAGVMVGTIGIAVILLSAYAMVIYMDEKDMEKEKDDDGLTWEVVESISSDMLLTGEYSGNPAGASGWLATFQLNRSETPQTCLASNASGGGYDSWGNVSGYVDADNAETDLASESGNYFVVRCRFNASVKDGADFIGSRCRVTLTVSGDETISAVAQTGDDDGTDNNGGGVCSYNNTAGEFIYINFYWDDNVDGYRITDDGSLDWSILIEQKC